MHNSSIINNHLVEQNPLKTHILQLESSYDQALLNKNGQILPYTLRGKRMNINYQAVENQCTHSYEKFKKIEYYGWKIMHTARPPRVAFIK